MRQRKIDFDIPIIRKENNPESQRVLIDQNKKLRGQCKTIFEALCRGEQLTVFSATVDYRIGDLRRRIKDLKDIHKIENIKSEWTESGVKVWYMEFKEGNPKTS